MKEEIERLLHSLEAMHKSHDYVTNELRQAMIELTHIVKRLSLATVTQVEPD